MMKRSGWTLPAILPLLSLTAALAATSGAQVVRGEIPEVFYSKLGNRAAPIWVSADVVRTPDNRIDWKLFSPDERESLLRKLDTQRRLKGEEPAKSLNSLQASGREAIADDNCLVYEKTFYHLSGERAEPGLAGLVQAARGIYSASIRSISQGFFLGSPASVLRLEVVETWKADDELPPVKVLFAVYPFARFAIGEGIFCSGVPGSTLRPSIGQKVIVFVSSDPLDRHHTLVWADPEFLIAEGSDGGVYLPRALKNDAELFPARNLDEVEEVLRRALFQLGQLRPLSDHREPGR